ncbi:MAG: hypothetical protein WC285_03080 [Candidatus Gracilibacteria bacterium]|jgi:hypothetical protein
MIEFPSNNSHVVPVKVKSYPTSQSGRVMQDVFREVHGRTALGYETVDSYLRGRQTGDDYVRVSPISEDLKVSYGYFWCVGVAGFGNHDGRRESFLSHGQDDVNRQVLYVSDAVKRLLDSCGDTCDFVIFGGQNNIPGASRLDGTLRSSLEIQKSLANMIVGETHGSVIPILIGPDDLDTCATDLIGKNVIVETPTRTLHVFERLILKPDDEPRYRTPEQRANRYQDGRSSTAL